MRVAGFPSGIHLGPDLKCNARKIPAHFLPTEISSSSGRIMQYITVTLYADQHDEVTEIPVENTRHFEGTKFIQLQ